MNKEVPKKKFKPLKLLAKILAGFFVFIILLVLFIRSPWGQGLIVDKVTQSISKKANTKIEIEKLFISFGGNIFLEGLYLEDQKGDTLLYSRSLEADLPLWPIIKGDGFSLDFLHWEGLRANVHRMDSIDGFNYQFLLDAYAGSDPKVSSAQDTTKASKISIGKLNFRDFDLTFKDEVTGIDSRLKMHKLDLEMQETDLENMKFHISSASLANASIIYNQLIPLPETKEESGEPLPVLIADRIQLQNVHLNYVSAPDGILSILDVGDFIANSAELNLKNNRIAIAEILLDNSEILVETTPIEEEIKIEEATAEKSEFEWPEWTVSVKTILLENNNLSYFSDGARIEKGIFNPQAIVLQDFDLNVDDLYISEKKAGMHLRKSNFREASGYVLKELAMDLELNDHSLDITGLNLYVNDNQLNGAAVLEYTSFEELISYPENVRINAELNKMNIWLHDVFPIQPDLKQNKYLVELGTKMLTGSLKIAGSLSSLEIPSLNLNWGLYTSLTARGAIEHPLEPKKLRFNFPTVGVSSTRDDVVRFIKEEDLGIRVPSSLSIRGSLEGSPEKIKTLARLETSQGGLAVNGNFSNAGTISYNAEVEVIDLNLGELFQNGNLGTLNMELSSRGSGTNMNELDATLASKITSLTYNGYQIKDWEIEGEIENGDGTITTAYKDDNLDADLQAFIELDSIAPKVIVDLHVIGADLLALGFTRRDIKGALQLNATFQGNSENYEFSSHLTDGVAVYDNQSYLLGDLDLTAFVRADTTSVDIRNKMIDLQLRSNASPKDFTNAIYRHYESYLTDEVRDTIAKPVELKLRGNINQSPIINDVFIANLTELDTVDIHVDFSEKNRTLVAAVELPYINYDGNIIDSLSFKLNSDRENFKFNFGFNALNAGPIAVKKTFLEGSIEDQMFYLDFNSYHQDDDLVHIASVISKEKDVFKVHLVPEDIILNSLEWIIPESNEILIGEKSIRFNDFIISRADQEISIHNSMPETQKEHIGIGFKNFNLDALFSYLNPDRSLASGNLNGNFIIEEPFSDTGLLANLEIQDLELLEVPLGVLNLDATAEGGQNYNLDLSIKGGDADLDLTGRYIASETGAQIDMELQLKELRMKAIQGFLDQAINTTSGSISGQMKLNGTIAEPNYEGNFQFNNAAFTVATLNAPFRIEDERLRIDTEGIYFDRFQIDDTQNNSFTVSGEVLTQTLLNPVFDLQFEASNFNVLNSTAEDNELYYGTASFQGTAHLTGDLNLPKLDVNIEVGSNTNVTYVIPEESLAIQERDGVVVFVNRKDPDDILTKSSQEESAIIAGVDIRALISIGKGATFTIVLDDQTEDNFQVKGEGDLNFNVYPNGRTTLSGRYEMSGGHYEMSLYGLVKRRFEIAPGSTITWAGEPFDANLDIRAIYKVETSASALMATQTAGADAAVRGRFRQQLPFLVYLNVDGELMQPQISFNLDMPENDQGAIGGQVYGRIQQLNNQEQELNKQVFSLLVLNRFFPETMSDGSGGGTVTVARDNLNQALSDQLNIFSEKLLGDTGVELDFGVDSFTDYQGESPQERTQVEITAQKKLLDDRLIVRVGSDVDIQGSSQVPGEASPIIGNVSIEYLITEDGIFRLKGFRKNQFENVIDGQLIISGIAFIFTREFNEFTELWKNFLKEEVDNTAE